MLTDEQLERYARHIVLKEIGGSGQRRLLNATVAIVGAGGIGSPAILYLAAAGIGTLRIIDDDSVSLSNLHRQVVFASRDVGLSKAEVAAGRVEGLNPDVRVDARQHRITAQNVADLLHGSDLVLDGSDNFATRLVVSDHCTAVGTPLVTAAIGQFQAQVGAWRGWEADAPCYRCFVGDAFDAEDCDSCSELGLIGAMAGIAGSWAALEAIRQLVPFGEVATGKLHLFDGLTPAARTIRIVKDPACSGCRGTAGPEAR